jgi:hypothetical protein
MVFEKTGFGLAAWHIMNMEKRRIVIALIGIMLVNKRGL